MRKHFSAVLFTMVWAQVALAQPEVAAPSLKTAKFWISCFGPDGLLLTTGGRPAEMGRYAESALLWNLDTGLPVREFSHQESIKALAFSPDGKGVATGGGTSHGDLGGARDTDIRLWDVSTGKEIIRFKGHEDYVQSLQFSPNGKWLLSGGDDSTARLWEVASGRQLFVWPKGPLENDTALSPDGRCVLTAQTGRVTIWDAATGKEVCRMATAEAGHGLFRSAEFSRDNKYVVTASFDKSVRTWNAQTGEQVRVFAGHTDHVETAQFSSDGAWIVSASTDKTVILWNAATGEIVRRFDHPRAVIDARFSADHTRIVARWKSAESPPVGPQNPYVAGISIWDAQSGKEMRQLVTHDSAYLPAPPTFTPDGKKCLLHIVRTDTIPGENVIEWVDMQTGEPLKEFK